MNSKLVSLLLLCGPLILSGCSKLSFDKNNSEKDRQSIAMRNKLIIPPAFDLQQPHPPAHTPDKPTEEYHDNQNSSYSNASKSDGADIDFLKQIG